MQLALEHTVRADLKTTRLECRLSLYFNNSVGPETWGLGWEYYFKYLSDSEIQQKSVVGIKRCNSSLKNLISNRGNYSSYVRHVKKKEIEHLSYCCCSLINNILPLHIKEQDQRPKAGHSLK